MKIAVIAVRVLLGLLLLFASVAFFANLVPPPELSGNAKAFFEGLAASRYIVPVVKVFEFLCGIAFLSGRFVPLAVVVFFPIAVNILLVHLLVMPDGLPVAIGVFVAEAFLVFANWRSFESLLKAK
ncbi:MAG: DoxX family protein [Acidobacteria bacterium]|nr:DoxX family protein [Acidobacteriota bacterium]